MWGPVPTWLPQEQIDEIFELYPSSEERSRYLIGLLVDRNTERIRLWRATWETLELPFGWFVESGTGTRPDFSDPEIIDFGQTLRLGAYEVGATALLCHSDRE